MQWSFQYCICQKKHQESSKAKQSAFSTHKIACLRIDCLKTAYLGPACMRTAYPKHLKKQIKMSNNFAKNFLTENACHKFTKKCPTISQKKMPAWVLPIWELPV
jgi:hypothetical protein